MPLVLFSGPHLHAEVHNPGAEVLFVTFDSWRRNRAGFAAWTPSQNVAAAGMAELIIKTARNDWYLNADLGPLEAALKAHTKGYRTVRSFAFSMGAYAALRLSGPLRLRNVVLVSPQFSPFADEPPHDPRYRAETRSMQAALGALALRVSPRLRGVVLFDPVGHPVDRAHAALITAQAPRVAPVAMALTGHPATQVMLETTEYKAMRALAFAGRSEPALYRALHVAARRQSPLYRARLAQYLAARALRHS